MTGAYVQLRDAGEAARKARAYLHEVAVHQEEVHAQLNRARTEYEAVVDDYHRLLLGVLRVLDDCAHLRGDPDVAVVHQGLLGLLDDQGVETIPVAVGDEFAGELHESRGTVPDPALPNGVIADVVAPGYRRRSGDATTVVRPAAVRVSVRARGKR
jgi:molecular chaperone GrpE (heat shock protein)